MSETIRTYSELVSFKSFLERYEYLKLSGDVGQPTFGFDRYLNQYFYKSAEWRSVRNMVIIRDNACDLAVPGRLIHSGLTIHHINPISAKQLLDRDAAVVDPEYLVCVSTTTHAAIHFSDSNLLALDPVERKPGDTRLW